MEKTFFAGIDPGQTGGIGIIDAQGRYIEAHRWSKREPRDIYNILYKYNNRLVMVYLENVNLPQAGQLENRFSAGANLLVNLGIWQGFLIALEVPYTMIHPSTWQAAQGLHRWQARQKIDPAHPCPLSLARSRWPGAPLEFQADDGKAVGLLLASYALQDHQKGIDRAGLQLQVRDKRIEKRRRAREIAKNSLGKDIPW